MKSLGDKMDFNETPAAKEEAIDLGAGELIPANAVAAGDLSEQLFAIRNRTRQSQAQMIAAFVKLASMIGRVKGELPASRLREYLASECGIDRADLNTYLKFSEALGEHCELIRQRALPFSVVKALVAAPARVREIAIERLASGAIIHTREISAIKRQFEDEAKDPQVERERRRQMVLRKAATRKAESTITAFGAEFFDFAQALVDFYNEEPPQDSFDETCERLKQDAGNCVEQFERLYDVSGFPAPWEYGFHGNSDEAVNLARSHDALKSLALGKFQEWDHENANPFDTRHNYIDRAIVESVIWLFDDEGISRNRLKQPKAAATPSNPKSVQPPNRLKSIEICAGAGGQAIGLHASGFQALGLYEQNKNAAETLKSNYPLGPVHRGRRQGSRLQAFPRRD